MKKKTLAEYARRMLEINKQNRDDKEDFSATYIIESLRVSPTQARRILKELHQERFLDKIKMSGTREPIYVLNEYSENILAELEKVAKKEAKIKKAISNEAYSFECYSFC